MQRRVSTSSAYPINNISQSDEGVEDASLVKRNKIRDDYLGDGREAARPDPLDD